MIIAGLALSDFGRAHRELLVTFALTGVGLLGVAAFNENTFYDAHLVLSLLAFAFGAISSLLVSIRLVKGLFRYFSLILGVMMLIGMVILYAAFFVAPIRIYLLRFRERLRRENYCAARVDLVHHVRSLPDWNVCDTLRKLLNRFDLHMGECRKGLNDLT